MLALTAREISVQSMFVPFAAGWASAGWLPVAQAASLQNVSPGLWLAPPAIDGTQTQPRLAQAATPPTPDATATAAPVVTVPGYFDDWFNHVEQAQASQPHRMSPLVTVTPACRRKIEMSPRAQSRDDTP